MEEEKNDPDAPILAWLVGVLADDLFRLDYRVSAATILIAHQVKWNSGRGMASGFASYEKVAEIKNTLRGLVLPEVEHQECAEDPVLEGMLMAAKVVLL